MVSDGDVVGKRFGEMGRDRRDAGRGGEGQRRETGKEGEEGWPRDSRKRLSGVLRSGKLGSGEPGREDSGPLARAADTREPHCSPSPPTRVQPDGIRAAQGWAGTGHRTL